MSWSDTLHNKINELESTASWASIVNLGRARDLCRQAKAELQRELDRMAEWKYGIAPTSPTATTTSLTTHTSHTSHPLCTFSRHTLPTS